MCRDKMLPGDPNPAQASAKYIKALKKGLLKIMSKMGISTLSSYQGAQIFEAIGIDQFVIDKYFTGTASRIRGVGLREIAEEALIAPRARLRPAPEPTRLDVGGHFHYRATGERHLWNPKTVAALQKAVRVEDAKSYEEYAAVINEQDERPMNLRGLWDFVPAGPAVPLDEVEPATSNREALCHRRDVVRQHLQRGAREPRHRHEPHRRQVQHRRRRRGPERFVRDANGDLRRSAVKQVASARFGVTAEYLVNADELQIKMAQGAKPGEGGQLPGHKVDEVIAEVRHSTPGVTLISPPPHHDIYSIEDLAQLIFDLKNVNPKARISVKLVAEAGVGTIAAGVAKAHADVILISGHNGGTGASPLTSIHHAGMPWELGLAEAQQVLVMNGLRGRARLQVDGQLYDRSRRRLRRAARRRGVRLRDRAARRVGLHHDAQVPPQHVPGRRRHARPRAAQEVHRQARARHPLLLLRRRRAPRHHGPARLPHRRTRWSAAPTASSRGAPGLHPKARKIDFSELLYRPKEAATSPSYCVERRITSSTRCSTSRLIARVEARRRERHAGRHRDARSATRTAPSAPC